MSTSTQRLKTTQSSSIISSSDHRPTVVLCSSNDGFLMSQDICTLCGSLGKADEGNLIACSQCGQCYHPFCVNIKGLKVVVSKGWRCLECTVCETCGLPGDEAKLLLCDECELSCHTYCLKPPLEEVPQGSWKCHWCVVCQKCGSHYSGVNSDWQKNYTECGPCSSLSTCPKCKVDYDENHNLIIQCIRCSRWLHALCDSIRDEEECELASELGYTCLLCRPKDEIPLYIVQRKLIEPSDQRNTAYMRSKDIHQVGTKNHDTNGQQMKLISDNNCNNENQNQLCIQSISNQSDFTRPQSAPLSSLNEIGDVSALPRRPASSLHFTSDETKGSPSINEDSNRELNDDGTINKLSSKSSDEEYLGLHMVDGVYLSEAGLNFIKSQKLEPAKRQRAKRGSKAQKLDDPTIDETNRDNFDGCKMITEDKDDEGKRKRVRKLSKLGIGGFAVRQRGARLHEDLNYSNSSPDITAQPQQTHNHLSDQPEESIINGITLMKAKRIRKKPRRKNKGNLIDQYPPYMQEAFFGKELLLNNELENSEDKYPDIQNDCSNTDLQAEKSSDLIRQSADNDSNCQSMFSNEHGIHKERDMVISNDVIDQSRQSDMRQIQNPTDDIDIFFNDIQGVGHPNEQLRGDYRLDLPKTSTFDNDQLKGDLFDTGPSMKELDEGPLPTNLFESKKDALDPLLNPEFNLDLVAQLDSKAVEDVLGDMDNIAGGSKVNQQQSAADAKKNIHNYELEESLGLMATKSAVLYANTEHPNLKLECKTPEERYKQIQKLWRQLPTERRKVYVERARENRSASKMASKPTSELLETQKKVGSSQIRPPSTPRIPYEGIMSSPQPVTLAQSPMPQANQDTRWRQPMPLVENSHHQTRYLASPHQQGQPQLVYSPSPHHQPPMHSPGFDGHQPIGQQIPPQSISMQQNQYSPQRQPQYINQQRMPGPNQQQFAQNPSVMQVSQGPTRMQQVPPQPQHMNYQQHRPQTPRFQGQNQPYTGHEVHQPHTPQPVMMNAPPMGPSPTQRIPVQQVASPQIQMTQQVASPQLQMQPQQISSPQLANSQIGSNQAQFHAQSNFIEGQPQPSSHYQGPSQLQHVMYGNNQQQPQIRRQFQPQQPAVQQQPNHIPQMQQQQQSVSQSQQNYVSQTPRPSQVLTQPHSQQQQSQVMFNSNNNLPSSNNLRLDSEDVAQILDDDDDLKDLGADFNILEYADPEPEKGASTSAGGKSNIELDAADLDEYFVDRDALEEKRASEPLFSMGSTQPQNQQVIGNHAIQQNQQQAQQVAYNPPPIMQNSQMVGQIQQNQNFSDNQQHSMNMPQQVHQSIPVQQNTHYSAQRQPQYVNQPRPITANTNHQQQFMPNQQPMIRSNMQHQVRMQVPQMQGQQGSQHQQIGYMQSPQSHRPRFHQPDQMSSHEVHQSQQHLQPQQQSMINAQQVGPAQVRPIIRPQKVSPPQLQRPQMRPQQVGSPQLQRVPMNTHQIGSPQVQMNPMQPQQIGSPQLQMQQSQPMQPNHQYHAQQGFMDNQHQPQQQRMHGNLSMQQQQQQQYHHQHHQNPNMSSQQSNIMYANQHNPQTSQRRPQFQPQQPPQQHYGYQQQHHQTNYSQQQMIPQQQQQQTMMGQGQSVGEMLGHEKNPIVGEPITSMHFTMYEQGSGSNNEAINPILHSSESANSPDPSRNRPVDEPIQQAQSDDATHIQTTPLISQNQSQNIINVPQPITEVLDLNHQPIMKPVVELTASAASRSDNPSFKFSSNISIVNSGRNSSCSVGNSEGEGASQGESSGLTAERSSSSSSNQPQNQLLKQLLGNCSSADSPNHDSGGASSLLLDCGTKTLPTVSQTIQPKQYGASNNSSSIPTISFQMDSSSRGMAPLVSSSQSISSISRPNKPSFINQGPGRAALVSSGGPVIMGSQEIKTYNVGPQVQPTVSLNRQPLPSPAAPTQLVGGTPIVHLRPEITQQQPHPPKTNEIQIQVQPVQSMPQQDPAMMMDFENTDRKPSPIARPQQYLQHISQPVGLFDGKMQNTSSQSMLFDLNMSEPISGNPSGDGTSLRISGKTLTAKQRKNDYMAKRRADLEKEPTPPPREAKPKKRVRGPSKRSRGDLNDDVRTIDSNSNTSEPSNQMLETGLPVMVVTPTGPPPKKRVRKSQIKALISTNGTGNCESLIANLATGIHRELPKILVKEPEICPSNNIACMFACGDLNSRVSKLRGIFGQATPVATYSAQVNKKGGKRKTVGYYHEEFPEDLEDPTADLFQTAIRSDGFERDCDSPASIISGSSGELVDDLYDDIDSSVPKFAHDIEKTAERYLVRDLDRYLSNNEQIASSMQPKSGVGQRPELAINGDSVNKMDENNNADRSVSPSMPVVTTSLPVICKSLSDLDALVEMAEASENNKENQIEPKSPSQKQTRQQQPQHMQEQPQELQQEETAAESNPSAEVSTLSVNNGASLNMRLKDHGDVSVTLTLTNKEADGVKKVLSSLTQVIGHSGQQSSSGLESQDSMIYEGHNNDENLGGNSFRLLTGVVPSNQEESNRCSYKGIKFNEQNFVPIGIDAVPTDRSQIRDSSSQLVDVKPEFCCRCRAIVVDRGIRKNISEIPETTFASMQKISLVKKNQVGELVFCSVHCYAASIMCLDSGDKNRLSKSGKPNTIAGLPPMSPMMEDDEDDLMNSDAKSSAQLGSVGELERQQRESPKPTETANSETVVKNNLLPTAGQQRRWIDIRYTRWTPSHFDLNKSTSPINMDDMRAESLSMTTPTSEQFPASSTSAQLVSNHGDSSIDSNESDNSTSYSQSISGRLAIGSDECQLAQVAAEKDSDLGVKNRFACRSTVKDSINPWPAGTELIQVLPIKKKQSIKEVVVKEEKPDGNASDVQPQSSRSHLLAEDEEFYRDTRRCVLCHELGDGDSDGPARLLNLFIDGWVHLNCALWSLDVYELANGALVNVELARRKAMACSSCRRPGATLKCFKPRCPNYYHFLCATKEKCAFYEDKSVQCRQHSKTGVKEMTSFVVKRRVYVNRDEQKQVAEMIQDEQQNVMRIGSLVFLQIGQLLPHQLASFHDQRNIFPVGYKIMRYYWSYRRFNKRSKYLCSIEDNEGQPRFRIVAQERGFADETFLAASAKLVWQPIIKMIVSLRKGVQDTITTFPKYIRGEDLFGLNEPSIVRILESIPGVETLTDYNFKFGRSPLLELPLAINPTGCARTEPKLRTHFKRPYTIHTGSCKIPKSRLQSASSSDSGSPYIKQFVHSKSSQYKKMKSEWRNNVVLARSRVQGLGLYAARDIEKHTMVIEYIGMLIRNEIAERYERIHEAHNRGIYMFRLDEDRVIDATLAGGLARYINHSCNPNCVAEAVEIDRERKILIIANRKILKGEELGYDYKLAIEDDQHKISCLCGAPTCKKWMN